MTERTARPIDPFSDRLAEMTLIRLCDDLHYLHYFAHHIVMDGSAAQVLTDRISEVYGALVEGVAPPPDFDGTCRRGVAQRRRLQRSTREASDREYWRERLLDLPPSVSIADRPGPVTTPALRSPGELPAGTLTRKWQRFDDARRACDRRRLRRISVTGMWAWDIVLSLPVSARTTALLRRSAGFGVERRTAESAGGSVGHGRRPRATCADRDDGCAATPTVPLRGHAPRTARRRGTHGARRSVRSARREHPAVPADGRVRPGHRRTVRPVDRAGRGPVADGLPGWRG
ncbi:hypothetical protein GS426_20175 [Rhodococcus hoagii]|nr:hypothetical protein [Prescottella equi]